MLSGHTDVPSASQVMSLLLAVADLALLALAVAPREQDPGPHVDEYGRRFISSKYTQRPAAARGPETVLILRRLACGDCAPARHEPYLTFPGPWLALASPDPLRWSPRGRDATAGRPR